jgi:hypothetical protein
MPSEVISPGEKAGTLRLRAGEAPLVLLLGIVMFFGVSMPPKILRTCKDLLTIAQIADVPLVALSECGHGQAFSIGRDLDPPFI